MSDRWGLVWGFDIDDGELDGLTPQMIFVLGIECGRVYEKMEVSMRFEEQVHVENVARLGLCATSHNWQSTVLRRDDHWATMRFERGIKS